MNTITNILTTARPFLKWPGGKRQLLSDIRRLMPKSFRKYHEVCVGAGAVFFDLRSNDYNDHAQLYDLNEELIRTYSAVKQSPPAVISAFNRHASNHREEYCYHVRSIDWQDLSDVQIAGRMLYLNRACFNGLYRVNKSGGFNSPSGKRASVSINEDNLYAASNALERTTLTQGDFGTVLDHARPSDFAFLDPPYPNGFTAYTSVGFDESDQRRLHDVCVELDRKNVMMMQTNADCPLTRKLYSDFEVVPVMASRNINCKGDGRGSVGEVIIINY